MAHKTIGGCKGDPADSLSRWFATNPGKELLERECDCVEELLSDLFGYYLLQVGSSREFVEPVAHGRIRHHLSVEARFPGMGAGGTVIGAAGALPVASDSVDTVFLPHTLDFAEDPRLVLRESERVLIPEGRVILLGFNPWGAWGLWRLFRRRSGESPWCGNFLSQRRVADWLTLLGFDIEQQRPLMFLPPLGRRAVMRKLEFLETPGLNWLPLFSSAYAIRAVKRVSTLTPLQPRWKSGARVLPGQAVEPTTGSLSGFGDRNEGVVERDRLSPDRGA